MANGSQLSGKMSRLELYTNKVNTATINACLPNHDVVLVTDPKNYTLDAIEFASKHYAEADNVRIKDTQTMLKYVEKKFGVEKLVELMNTVSTDSCIGVHLGKYRLVAAKFGTSPALIQQLMTKLKTESIWVPLEYDHTDERHGLAH